MSNCAWCPKPIPLGARRDSKFCSKRCRQASWRFKVGRSDIEATDRPMRFAYADPPYPGKAFYYPERQEVDHASLVDRMVAEFPDGWALSTSSRSLRDVLPICPSDTRVCAWFRGPRPSRARHALMSWEPLLVWRGRPLDAAVVQGLGDGLIAQGRFRTFPGAMIGMKPPAYAEWMFRQLGSAPGDELADLFPGSGAISRAWIRYTSPAPADDDESLLSTADASAIARADASLPGKRDASAPDCCLPVCILRGEDSNCCCNRLIPGCCGCRPWPDVTKCSSADASRVAAVAEDASCRAAAGRDRSCLQRDDVSLATSGATG